MSRINESTPLLDKPNAPSSSLQYRRKSVWQFVIAGVLSLSILSLFQQQMSIPVDLTNVAVSFDATRPLMNEADTVAFLSTMETMKDSSLDPCIDFYQYACGHWLQTHDIPSNRSSIDTSFTVASEHNRDIIQRILNQDLPRIGPFYRSCLSDEEMDTSALAFVTQWITNIHQVNATLALMEVAGKMDQMLGISTFFSLTVDADPRKPSVNVLKLSQGGLTLPSREYYLEQRKVDAYTALYVEYASKLFGVGDLDHPNVSEFAETVLKIETAFANISLPNEALRDPWKTNTAYPFAEIAQRYPFVMAYLNGIYKQEAFPMLHAIIATPDFFEAQNQLLTDEALLPQLKEYLIFRLVDSFAIILGEYFRRASHDFHGKIEGAGDLPPRNHFCMSLTTAFLGDDVGKYYMQDVFGPDAKNAAEALVSEIEESLKALLLTEAWLDKVTYDAAAQKLNKVKHYIGGPADVPPLPFNLQADAFFDNVIKLMQLDATSVIQAIGKRVNEKAWDMFPFTVNAYYDPSANKMVFPAAILQPPFYSADQFPAAANFARIGMVMGHELSHGIDDQGQNYDSNGALRSWWTPSVSDKFAEKAQCLAAQYSTFPIVSVEDNSVLGTVNGNLTLGENIADNGGIRLAYDAYHLWKKTFEASSIVPSSGVSPETTSPETAVVSPPDKQVPGKHTPAANLPLPLPSVPNATTPKETQTKPDNGLAGPPLVPEPQPADIGSSKVVPHDIAAVPGLPAPAKQVPPAPKQEPAEKASTEMPVTPKLPVDVPHVPVSPPDDSIPAKLPVDVPHAPVSPPDDSIPAKLPVDVPHAPASPPNGSIPPKLPVDVPHAPVSPPDDSIPAKLPVDVPHAPASPPNGSIPPKLPVDAPHAPVSSPGDSTPPKPPVDVPHASASPPNDSTPPKPPVDVSHAPVSLPGDSIPPKLPVDVPHAPASPPNESTPPEAPIDELQPEPVAGSPNTTSKDKHKKEEDKASVKPKTNHHTDKQKRQEKKGESDKAGAKVADDNGHSSRQNSKHHSVRANDDGKKNKSGNSNHAQRSSEDDDKADQHTHRKDEDDEETSRHTHRKDEDKEERREARKERKEEKEDHHRQSKENKHRHHHDEDYEEESKSRHHEKDKEHHECRKEDAGCGSKHYDWVFSQKTYPFSGGDARLHSMVKKLARSMVQPNDPVADDRLFFTAFAQNWCEKRTLRYAELLRTIDPHSPGRWRVNGPLMIYNKFAEAFSCPLGTPMNPEKKCVIW